MSNVIVFKSADESRRGVVDGRPAVASAPLGRPRPFRPAKRRAALRPVARVTPAPVAEPYPLEWLRPDERAVVLATREVAREHAC